jgi:hypothetical protein
MTDAQLIRRYWDAQDPRDYDALARMRHPDFQVHWPQSGERVPSQGYPQIEGQGFKGEADRWRSAAASMLGARPVHLTGAGDTWIGQSRLTYGDGSIWHAVLILEMLSGFVHRETTWYAPVRETPSWRDSLSETFEWSPGSDVVESVAPPGQTRSRRQAIERYLAGLAEDPAAAHTAFLHEDAVAIMPQSSEQISGRDQILASFLANPARPELTARRILVVGGSGLVELRMREGEKKSFSVWVIDFEGDMVRNLTGYWAPRLDPPEWRTQWVEQLDDQ